MKVLITPRSFGKNNTAPLEILRSSGIETILNDTGGIMTEDQIKTAISGCEGIIIGVDPLNANVLSQAPGLKAVAKYGVGLDNIDLDYCHAHNIAVSKTTGANSAAVADYAFSLMLALARKIIPIDSGCRQNNWKKITTSDVYGKTLGLIGLGAIGRQMVTRAKGFSMNIKAFDVFWDNEYAASEGIEKADIDCICRECDFISLHLPLLEDTRNIIGESRIRLMKPTAFLINTARGGLIDDDALLTALKENRIAGAGLDAFAEEPPKNQIWYALENVVIGSHCAASTESASNMMGIMAAENLLRDLHIKND